MEAKELIAEILTTLEDLKNSKENSIEIEFLEGYLKALSKDTDESQFSRQQEQERNLEHYQVKSQNRREFYKARIQRWLSDAELVTEAGREALRSIIIVNGGAVIALLAFMGKLFSESDKIASNLASCLPIALFFFTCGVLFGSLGFGSRYLSIDQFSKDNRKIGEFWKKISITLSLAAYFSFIAGSFIAAIAFMPPISPDNTFLHSIQAFFQETILICP